MIKSIIRDIWEWLTRDKFSTMDLFVFALLVTKVPIFGDEPVTDFFTVVGGFCVYLVVMAILNGILGARK